MKRMFRADLVDRDMVLRNAIFRTLVGGEGEVAFVNMWLPGSGNGFEVFSVEPIRLESVLFEIKRSAGQDVAMDPKDIIAGIDAANDESRISDPLSSGFNVVLFDKETCTCSFTDFWLWSVPPGDFGFDERRIAHLVNGKKPETPFQYLTSMGVVGKRRMELLRRLDEVCHPTTIGWSGKWRAHLAAMLD